MARALDDPATLTQCLLAHHDAVWGPGIARLRLTILDEAARAAEDAGDPVLAWQALLGRFVALLELADPAAYTVFLRAVEAADRLGQPHYRWLVLIRRAALAIFAGRADEADVLVDQVAADADRLGEPDAPTVIGDLRIQLALLRSDQLPPIQRWGLPTSLPPWMVAQLDGLSHRSRGTGRRRSLRTRHRHRRPHGRIRPQ